MIICVCKRVSDHQIRALAKRGCDSTDALSLETGCGTCCGQCVPHVQAILDTSIETSLAGSPLAAAA